MYYSSECEDPKYTIATKFVKRMKLVSTPENETKNGLSLSSADSVSRITKRKFEVPWSIKFAIGCVIYFCIHLIFWSALLT